MTDALRKKLRPLIAAIVEPLVEEAIARAEATVRERFADALEPTPVRTRRPSVKPPRKAKRTTPPKVAHRDVKSPKVVHRDPKPDKLDAKQVDEAARILAKSSTPARRPCGCAPRGRHASTCTASKVSAPAATRDTSKLPSAPISPADSAAAQRRADILARAQARQGTIA